MTPRVSDPSRRGLDARERAELKERGKLRTLGGFTLARLVADLNEVGIGPEDVEVSGSGVSDKMNVDLFVVGPDE